MLFPTSRKSIYTINTWGNSRIPLALRVCVGNAALRVARCGGSKAKSGCDDWLVSLFWWFACNFWMYYDTLTIWYYFWITIMYHIRLLNYLVYVLYQKLQYTQTTEFPRDVHVCLLVWYSNRYMLPGSQFTEDPVKRVMVKLRYTRNPVVGDKFSSRHGQKGVPWWKSCCCYFPIAAPRQVDKIFVFLKIVVC